MDGAGPGGSFDVSADIPLLDDIFYRFAWQGGSDPVWTLVAWREARAGGVSLYNARGWDGLCADLGANGELGYSHVRSWYEWYGGLRADWLRLVQRGVIDPKGLGRKPGSGAAAQDPSLPLADVTGAFNSGGKHHDARSSPQGAPRRKRGRSRSSSPSLCSAPRVRGRSQAPDPRRRTGRRGSADGAQRDDGMRRRSLTPGRHRGRARRPVVAAGYLGSVDSELESHKVHARRGGPPAAKHFRRTRGPPGSPGGSPAPAPRFPSPPWVPHKPRRQRSGSPARSRARSIAYSDGADSWARDDWWVSSGGEEHEQPPPTRFVPAADYTGLGVDTKFRVVLKHAKALQRALDSAAAALPPQARTRYLADRTLFVAKAGMLLAGRPQRPVADPLELYESPSVPTVFIYFEGGIVRSFPESALLKRVLSKDQCRCHGWLACTFAHSAEETTPYFLELCIKKVFKQWVCSRCGETNAPMAAGKSIWAAARQGQLVSKSFTICACCGLLHTYAHVCRDHRLHPISFLLTQKFLANIMGDNKRAADFRMAVHKRGAEFSDATQRWWTKDERGGWGLEAGYLVGTRRPRAL